ncbi:MAG: phospholipase D-like domain-containing protein, partial [Thermoanaerobaculia bacterium]|nr:phospholipase D-like domain-containing protein [Thermoanaerobaculia bacterium]
GGNRVTPLRGGDEAYPEMLDAIAGASRSVLLSTYIFDHDRAGTRFLEALAAAGDRGVEVRVLIDSVGARYSRPRMPRKLAARAVPVAEFLPPSFPLRNPYVNLRNHRKILIVDGGVAFTGGLNIREGCLLALEPPAKAPTEDLHFRVEGPVVGSLFDAAALDWEFATGEHLTGPAWRLDIRRGGSTLARSVPDGPDEDFETIRTLLLGALSVARHRVGIVTPYFLPDQVLVSALRVAALRGTEIDIVLPERGNLRLVRWASTAQLWQPLAAGCRVWLTPEPFDHTKLMVVDGAWSFVGSATWDARSLRLNFELNLECFDEDLAAELEGLVAEKKAAAHRLTAEELASRPLPLRLRDGVARLFSPYL